MGWSGLSLISEDEREFFQRRVGLFGLVAGGLWLGGFALRFVVSAASDGLIDVSEPNLVYHFLTAVPLLIAWAVCRGRPLSMGQAIAVQAFGLLGAAGFLLAMGLHIPFIARPDLIMAFGLALIMFARTVYVPTPWQVTLGQCVVIGAGLLFTVHLIFERIPVNTLPMSEAYDAIAVDTIKTVSLVSTGAWWLLTAALCVGATRVIHGLRKEAADVRKLGQYTLERKLGEGGMGIVYEASHAMLRRPTAVKLLLPDKTGEQNIARFEREVQQTARLTHPNTVTVFDYGRTPDGLFYYAMELIDGATLSDIVSTSGPQSPARVAHVLAAAAGALSEAHAVDLTHRDIKPANVMLCDRGGIPDTVKLLDFGLVKDLSTASVALSQTNAGAVQGTPQYLPPEAITNPDSVDARSDLYALGAVGYYLLVGEHVFGGGSIVEVCSHHLHSTPMPPSERLGTSLPGELERLVLACLEKDPANRPQTAEELQRMLRACTAGEPWTDAHARAWWREFGARIRDHRASSAGSATEHTIAIDLAKRRRATTSYAARP